MAVIIKLKINTKKDMGNLKNNDILMSMISDWIELFPEEIETEEFEIETDVET
ncbi:MAG: hypothetical protein HQK70_15675 [Desulfamplus sp.]|nr:hypothetical protein [Desulfamplus sp.]